MRKLKLMYLILIPALVQAQQTGSSFLKSETENVVRSGGLIIALALAAIPVIISAMALVVPGIMGYRAYNFAKEQREGNPALAGAKHFGLWAVVTMVSAGMLIYGVNQALNGKMLEALGALINRVLGLI